MSITSTGQDIDLVVAVRSVSFGERHPTHLIRLDKYAKYAWHDRKMRANCCALFTFTKQTSRFNHCLQDPRRPNRTSERKACPQIQVATCVQIWGKSSALWDPGTLEIELVHPLPRISAHKKSGGHHGRSHEHPWTLVGSCKLFGILKAPFGRRPHMEAHQQISLLVPCIWAAMNSTQLLRPLLHLVHNGLKQSATTWKNQQSIKTKPIKINIKQHWLSSKI